MTFQAVIDAKALDELFAPFDSTSAPGFAVGVAVGGVPRYRRGFGLASVELPVALSPTIRMRIGSTTKHFCALAVLLLQEEGRLSIDDSPRAVLPELPAFMDAVTLRQLMSHTSGMRDSLDLLLLTSGPGNFAAPDAQFDLLTGLDSVNFAAGAKWSYNNGGYLLLSLIVERVGGMPLGDFLRTRILEPVGMSNTVLRPYDTELLPNSATLHLPSPAGGWTRGVFGPPITGEGGLVSTVDDMLLWLRHMDAPVVGNAATWETMRTPLTSHGYGLGLMMEEHRGLRTVSHAGGVVGGSSQMLKVVDCGLDLILMTNGQSTLDMYRLVDEIIDRCIPGLPAPAGDASGAPMTGTFFSPVSGRTIALAEHGNRQFIVIAGMTLPARQEADGRLSVAILPTDLRLQPVADGAGAVVALEATEFGLVERLDRVAPPEHADLADHQGRFASTDGGLAARLEGTTLTLDGISGVLDYALAPVGPDLWQGVSRSTIPIGITIEFDRTGFLLTSGRTERLRFVRPAIGGQE